MRKTRPQPSKAGRPLIGIASCLGENDIFYLRRYYAEAVEYAGGLPVHIPLIADAEYLDSLAARLDGILLSGSNSDMDPCFYGEEPHPKLGTVIPERDETDLILLDLVEKREIPLLAICFGMQSLNISRGGTLMQDIGLHLESPLKHEQGKPVDRRSHSISIEKGTALARLAGDVSARVNSSHHQAVREIGRELRPVAWAADGIVEAIVDTRPGRFALGVQWHPEIAWERDDFSRGIFREFVAASAGYAISRGGGKI